MADVPVKPREHAVATLRHALEILGRASADWHGNGSADTGPLHWPVAVNLARRELRTALEALDESDATRGADIIGLEDARAGMAWWNSLTPTRRREWLEAAHSGRPADAWNAFKAQGA